MTEIEDIRNNAQPKEPVRCTKCDTIIEHYNTFLTPTNETNDVCSECLQREDKGYNTKREWKRASRRGVLPR